MKRPKQLPAVDRNNVTKRAAAPAGAKVGPSGILDTISPLLSTISPLLGMF
jgi:hypothetical protein